MKKKKGLTLTPVPASESAEARNYSALWAAVVMSGVQDYRAAVMDGDRYRQSVIKAELDAMGYQKYIRKIRDDALDFYTLVVLADRHMQPGESKTAVCPGCKQKRVSIKKGRKYTTASCCSCGLRWRKDNKI